MLEKSTENLNGKAKRILFESMNIIVNNIQDNIEYLDNHFKYTQKFINAIQEGLQSKRKFFLLASGRSAFILQCFATRLVHLGAEVYVVTNLASNPALGENDILIVLSGSGTTTVVVSLLETFVNHVKPHSIITITSHPETLIGRMGDITIKLKGRTKRDTGDEDTAILTPEGTMFEQISFCYLDAIIAELAIKLNISNKEMASKHSRGC